MAASLEDYQRRIQTAIELAFDCELAERISDARIAEFKGLLPKTEEIETAEQTIQVDNTWLHIALDVYREETKPEKKRDLQEQLAARLRALQESVRGSQAQADDASDSSDPHTAIRQILQRSEYREKKEDWLTAKIKQIRNAIFDLIREIIERVRQAIFGSGGQLSWVFRVVVILVVAVFLVMAGRLTMRFRRGKKKEGKRTILGEEIEEDVTAKDLAEAASVAARIGDFRTAIRKLYLSFLYELADRQLIELEANATNRDYLNKVSRFAPLLAPMRFMTERFDYVWYGMFPTSPEDYLAYQRSYEEALRSVQSLAVQPALVVQPAAG